MNSNNNVVKRHHSRLLAAGVTVAALAMLAPTGSASAHVTVKPSEEVSAGGRSHLSVRVPHGCDGAATDTVTVQIPAGFTSVKPQAIAGWEATVELGEIEPYEAHGEMVTKGVVSVTWVSTSAPLADDQYMDFGLLFKAPEEAGEYTWPAVQLCGDAEAAWIGAPESDYPAPTLTVVAADSTAGGHGSTAGTDASVPDVSATHTADTAMQDVTDAPPADVRADEGESGMSGALVAFALVGGAVGFLGGAIAVNGAVKASKKK